MAGRHAKVPQAPSWGHHARRHRWGAGPGRGAGLPCHLPAEPGHGRGAPRGAPRRGVVRPRCCPCWAQRAHHARPSSPYTVALSQGNGSGTEPRCWYRERPGRARATPQSSRGRLGVFFFIAAIVGSAVLSALRLCSLSSPPTTQSSDCAAALAALAAQPLPLQKTRDPKKTPLPHPRRGGEEARSHAVLAFKPYFAAGLQYLPGSYPDNWLLLPAGRSLVATLCGRLGVGHKASPERRGAFGVGMGESSGVVARWWLWVHAEAWGGSLQCPV